MMVKDDKHKILNTIIMDIEKQKHILDRTFAFIQSTLISLEANEKLEGEEKDWLIKDLREKLNEREKATATLTYLKYIANETRDRREPGRAQSSVTCAVRERRARRHHRTPVGALGRFHVL